MRALKGKKNDKKHREELGSWFLAMNGCLPDGTPVDGRDPSLAVERYRQHRFEEGISPMGLNLLKA